MNLPDVNVLVALYRPEHPAHRAAREWWEGALRAGQPFTVAEVVWLGFIRTVTNRRIFAVPATLEEALSFVEALTAQPLHLRFVTDPRTQGHFTALARAAAVKGDLVSDTYIAACASVYGATVVTFDRDFRKFDGLRVLELAA